MLVGDIICYNASFYGDKIGIVDEQVRLTWREANLRVNRLANALLSLGLQKGDRIAWISENCHQLGEIMFATAKIGVIHAGLNYRLTERQLELMVQDLAPKAVFIQNQFSPVLDSLHSRIEGIQYCIGLDKEHGYDYDYESLISGSSSEEPQIELEENDVCSIAYTSGTTGLPKGPMITHKNRIVLSSLEAFYLSRATPQDAIIVEPPFYTFGGQWRFLASCYSACTVVIIVLKAKNWVEMVERERVTVSYIAPTRYRMYRDYLDASEHKYDLSNLRALPIGAQSMPREQLQEMLDYFGVRESFKVYGGTEMGVVTWLSPEDVAAGLHVNATDVQKARLDSVGKAAMGVKVRIIDENGRDVSPGQVGEIITRGDTIMKGYWRKPEIDKQVFRNGWYYTNDLGKFDNDGYIYFLGRKDYMIKSGQLFVAPGEVEQVITQLTAVADVAVIGVPDEKWGEAVKAVIALKTGHTITETDIQSHCRKHLAGYQVPKSVDFWEELPKDDRLRIKLGEIRRSYWGDTA